MEKKTDYYKSVNIIEVSEFISLFSTSENYEKWFSAEERQIFLFPERAKSLAARYLVKKSISEKLNVVNKLDEIKILNDTFGKPEIFIGENLKEKMEQEGIKKIICSLSHSKKYAVGMTIFCC